MVEPLRTPVPRVVSFLEPFVDAGVFGSLEIGVVETYARLVDPAPEELLALAVAVRGSALGHVCVRLGEIPGSLVVEGTDPTELETLEWPPAERLAEALAHGRLTRLARDPSPGRPEPGVILPLVLDGDRLYLQRQWVDETTVVEEVTSRLTPDPRLPAGAGTDIGSLLDEVFGPEQHPPDAQRQAAALALSGAFTLISGGPGTGKTRTVARILAVAHLAGRVVGRAPRVALVAPTGKAAARMGEAVAHEIGLLNLPEDVVAPMAATPHMTVHRLLGAGPTGFRHDAAHPLLHDMVIVDEVSMVSLPLMTALMAALRRSTRLVLVGDPYQLASVEVGALLADMVAGAAGSPQGALAGRVVTLERVHRFASDSGTARLAGLIRDGNPRGVVELLSSEGPGGSGSGELSWVESGEELDSLADELSAWGRELVEASRRGDTDRALEVLGRRRVLCAHRRGPSGVEAWNALLEQRILALTHSRPSRSGWYPGRPVMVTRNDYRTGLFNGDTGVAVVVEGVLQVVFEGPEGPRLFEPSGLSDVTTVWAMTIHKSQGSEFAHPLVVLPDPPSPLLNRELFYTGVTRARSRLTVVASTASVRSATSTSVTRASGLAERLSGQG